jgi:Tol biopolymer transport system component
MSEVLPRLTSALSSRYRLSRQIGVGGMATVYLAHDLRHERDVAIKVLHPDLAAALGAERFLAEIKTTAKLQHPHILPLLDSGEADGLLYYVMPYVQGESLRTRLERETQLAVDDAVRIAREVLSALDYAHRHGVVHRDIKPENILLHEDQALVADFGIALAVSAAGGARMTQTGLSLGTPQYMAPEQAVGERAIDGRADIYALGAVLYEMLVGEAPFTGPTVQAIVARVMTEQPRAVTGQRRSVPPQVNAAVLRALEKIPADRFHSAAEFSTALVTAGFDTTTATTAPAPGVSRDPLRFLRRPSVAWGIAGLCALVAVLVLLRYAVSKTEQPVAHLMVELEPGMELDPNRSESLQLSDDGSMMVVGVVVQNNPLLLLRRLAVDSLQRIPGSNGLTGGASFSPDGRWVAFASDEKLLKAPTAGGPPTFLAPAKWGHIAWAGNALVYTNDYNTGLSRVSAEGRDTTVLTRPNRKRGELGHWWPQLLPDGDHIIFTNYTTPADNSKIEVLSLTNGERKVVLEGGYYARYTSGQLLFVRGEAIMSVPFDPRRLRVTGSAAPTGLDVIVNATSGWAGLSVARNGTLAYIRGGGSLVELVWMDDRGNFEPAIDAAAKFSGAAVSPDGRRIAVVRDGDVWVYDRARRLFTRLTRSEQRETALVWTPDSREVIYIRDVPQFDVFKRAADGSHAEELMLTSKDDKTPSAISPDGKTLLFDDASGGDEDIWAAPMTGGPQGQRQHVVSGPANQRYARFSPDGKWLTYQSNESGRNEVYLSPYPVDRGAARLQVTTDGGQGAEWSSDGRTIYYTSSGRIFRVQVKPEAGEIGVPQALPQVDRFRGMVVAPDGRLLVWRTPKGAATNSINVILNWASTVNH